MQRWHNVLILLVTFLLFYLPYLIEKLFSIEIPNVLEGILISFIFSSTILGELSDFYSAIPIWDTLLHTLNGFLAAGVGFSLIYILNNQAKGIKLSPLFLALVSFCFSMTIGVVWEFMEFSADQILSTDMQKDRIVRDVNSYKLDPSNTELIKLTDIKETIIISIRDEEEVVKTKIPNGHLDIGLIDTMKDLYVNLIGAVFFSVFGYFYSSDQHNRFKFIRHFLPEKK